MRRSWMIIGCLACAAAVGAGLAFRQAALEMLPATLAAALVGGSLAAGIALGRQTLSGASRSRLAGGIALLVAGSAVVAALLAWCVSLIARRLDLRNENSALLLLGMILLALSLTKMANLSTLLVPLLAGTMLRNSTERPWVWPRHFGTAGGALVLLLFVITGSVWSVDALMTGAALGVAASSTRDPAPPDYHRYHTFLAMLQTSRRHGARAA